MTARTEDIPKASCHLGRNFDAGKSAACDDYRIPFWTIGALCETIQMQIERKGLRNAVDAEAMLIDAGHRRTEQAAARGKHQPVVTQFLRLIAAVRKRNRLIVRIYPGDCSGNEIHIDSAEEIEKRHFHFV